MSIHSFLEPNLNKNNNTCQGGDAAQPSSALWVDKYRPLTIHQMCYPVFANKLKAWLENFYAVSGTPAAADPKRVRGVLLSGPPGVGKTTTVHVVAAELGLTVVEYNASDFRSRKSLHEKVSTMTTNRGFEHERTGYGKMVLLMDEVDGCDIGGVGEVIEMLKKTQVPILCTCNDRWHPKLRSLVNHVEDMKFSKPPCNIVANFLCDRVLAREGITLSKSILQDIIKQSGSDIRHMLNNLQMWCLNRTSLQERQLAACATQSAKNGDAGLFDSAEFFLLQGTSRGEPHTLQEMEAMYYNADLIDMFVQENYLHYNPSSSANPAELSSPLHHPYYARPSMSWMASVAMAADAISRADAAQKMMYIDQNWSVSRAYTLLSSTAPCVYTRGKYESFCTGQQIFFDRQRPVKFPSWLGNNSTANKNKRLLRCITMQAAHPRKGLSASMEAVMTDYIPLGLAPRLTRPLAAAASENGGLSKEEGIERVIQVMEQYHLMRDDWDCIVGGASFRRPAGLAASASAGTSSSNKKQRGREGDVVMRSDAAEIATAVKSAFTRTFNKKNGGQQSYVKAALRHIGENSAAAPALEDEEENGGDDGESASGAAAGGRHGKKKDEKDGIPGVTVISGGGKKPVKKAPAASGGTAKGKRGGGKSKAAAGKAPAAPSATTAGRKRGRGGKHNNSSDDETISSSSSISD